MIQVLRRHWPEYLKEATVLCGKLHHDKRRRCIFRCRYGATTPNALG